MAYNQNEFNSAIENVGQKWDPKEKLARVVKLIVTDKNFQFATQTDAEDEDKWTDAIAQIALRIRPLPFIYSNEDASEDTVNEDFTGGDSIEVRKGRYAETFKMYVSVSDMVKLASYNNKGFRIIEIDANGNILGTSPDGTVFKGFETSEFSVGKMNRTMGDVNRLVPVFVKYREPSEWTEQAAVVKPLELSVVADRWDPRDLDGLTDVTITVDSAIATKIVVTATATLKGVLLSGFSEITDWILTDAQSITGVTDNNDGTYDLAGTALVTGTINLEASADLSQAGYEAEDAAVVTIS